MAQDIKTITSSALYDLAMRLTDADAGGPAFPGSGPSYPQPSGMTLRDYFAAKVVQTMCEEVSRYDQFQAVAKDAYKMADAMLEARG